MECTGVCWRKRKNDGTKLTIKQLETYGWTKIKMTKKNIGKRIKENEG